MSEELSKSEFGLAMFGAFILFLAGFVIDSWQLTAIGLFIFILGRWF